MPKAAPPGDVKTAFESTDRRLRLLIKQLQDDAPKDEDLDKEIKRSLRQIRNNRELLGRRAKRPAAAKA
jgi:hypothetical protein